MSNELVFITGGTGHIGFKTLVIALQAGYKVRAAVRSEAKRDSILATKSIKDLNPGTNLTFVIVPDLTVEGAYDEAVKGATYIIHIASPIVLKGEILPENYHSTLIVPAINATVSILKAANKTTGVKRVVITSSIVAIIHAKYMFEMETPLGSVWRDTDRIEMPQAPYPSDFHAYNAGKIAALAATEDFVRNNKTSFDIVNIGPSFVAGKDELITDAKDIALGTNGPIAAIMLGNKASGPLPSTTVHVDDVAFMHVKALDSSIPAAFYIADSEGYAGTQWGHAARIIAEAFPKAVAKGVVSKDGLQPTMWNRVDASLAEKTFGFKFAGYDKQVQSVVGHYLELIGEKAE